MNRATHESHSSSTVADVSSPPVRPQKERWLPLAEAARELHISIDTARRRLRKGLLEGEQRATPQGFTWWVRAA